jgi:hypothetical protein
MSMQRIFAVMAAVAPLALAFVSGEAVAQTKPIKDQLVGTWTFVASSRQRHLGT